MMHQKNQRFIESLPVVDSLVPLTQHDASDLGLIFGFSKRNAAMCPQFPVVQNSISNLPRIAINDYALKF